MSIVTIMLGVILGLVFYFTRANLETESIAMMQNIASQPFHPGIPNESGGEVRLPYFILQVSPRGELIATSGGYYDLSNDAFLSDLIDMAFASPKAFGVIEGYHLRYYRVGTPIDQCLVFTDISSEVATLDHLTKTCLFLGGLGFGVFLAISILLSGWAVRPVELAWKQQRQFVADASHELKTPLTIIDANTEVMEMESGESQWTKSTRKQIVRLSALVQQLVTLTRLDEDRGLEEKMEFDFSDTMEDVVQPYEAPAQVQGKNLQLTVEPGIVCRGNEKSIRQLLGILMDNAMKYSSENAEIRVSLKKKGKKILLEIYNDAENLPEGRLDVLFERFYRLDSSRNSSTGGSGIGLSVAQAIVQAHKGKITAENRTGKGLDILIIL